MALAKLITWTSEPKSLEIRLVVRARFSDTPLRTWCLNFLITVAKLMEFHKFCMPTVPSPLL